MTPLRKITLGQITRHKAVDAALSIAGMAASIGLLLFGVVAINVVTQPNTANYSLLGNQE